MYPKEEILEEIREGKFELEKDIFFFPKGYVVFPEKEAYDNEGNLIAKIDKYGRCTKCRLYVGYEREKVNKHFQQYLVE